MWLAGRLDQYAFIPVCFKKIVDWLKCLETCVGVGLYRQVSNIRRAIVGNEIIDHSDVVGASPVGVAPTTSSFST